MKNRRLLSAITSRTPRGLAAVSVIAGLLLVATVSWMTARHSRETPPKLVTALAERGLFYRSVDCEGQIRSLEPVVVESQCYWRVRILDLVPEGTFVKKGDVICRLDSAELESDADERRIKVIRAQGLLDAARANEAMQSATNARREATAELDALLAETQLDSWDELESEQALEDINSRVEMAEEEYLLACNDLDYQRQLAQDGTQSWDAVTPAIHRKLRSQRGLDIQRGQRHLMKEYEHPRKTASLTTKVALQRNDIVRTALRSELYLTTRRLATMSAEKKVAAYERSLKYRTDSIAACTIVAPCDGEVMHCNSWTRASYGYDKYIEPGAEVRYQQDIVTIVDRSRLKIKARVSDRFALLLQPNMPADVFLPGRVDSLQAHVSWISPISFRRSKYTPHIRHHWIEVRFDESEDVLRRLTPRTDVNIRILCERREEVLQVPVNSVVEYDGACYVVVNTQDGLEVRQVSIGHATEKRIEIIAGIVAGDEVVTETTENLRQLVDELRAL